MSISPVVFQPSLHLHLLVDWTHLIHGYLLSFIKLFLCSSLMLWLQKCQGSTHQGSTDAVSKLGISGSCLQTTPIFLWTVWRLFVSQTSPTLPFHYSSLPKQFLCGQQFSYALLSSAALWFICPHISLVLPLSDQQHKWLQWLLTINLPPVW